MQQTIDPPLPPPAAPRRFKSLRTIGALLLREMMTSYGRTPGGYLWAILQPVAGIALLTLILSYGLRIRTPGLGTSLPLFFATGVLTLTMTLAIANNVASSLSRNKALLFYPGVKHTDAILAGFILTMLTQIMVLYIVFSGIHIAYDVSSIINVTSVLMSVGFAALFGLGLGVMNCFLFNAFPLWQRIWSILTTPLFIISCVIFLFEDLPRQWQDILWWNPLVHLIGMMRRGFYASYDAVYVSPLYLGVLSMLLLTMGLLFLHRFHRTFLER